MQREADDLAPEENEEESTTMSKKIEKRLASAQASAKSARERVKEVALGAAIGGGIGAVFGDELVTKLPGNTAAEMAVFAAKKKGPASNKRVQWAAGGLAATVALGSKDAMWAAGTGVMTALFAIAVTAHKASVSNLNIAALAYDAEKK